VEWCFIEVEIQGVQEGEGVARSGLWVAICRMQSEQSSELGGFPGERRAGTAFQQSDLKLLSQMSKFLLKINL